MKRDYNGKIKNNSLSLEDQVLYTTIPLWKIPYEEQVMFTFLIFPQN